VSKRPKVNKNTCVGRPNNYARSLFTRTTSALCMLKQSKSVNKSNAGSTGVRLDLYKNTCVGWDGDGVGLKPSQAKPSRAKVCQQECAVL
jgi:hypothetical protein